MSGAIQSRVYISDEKNITDSVISDALSHDDFHGTDEQVDSMAELASHAYNYGKSMQQKRHYDFKTKNTSFIDTYKDLRKLNIKNNKFHLTIFNKNLVGVDPYSPLLPKELQLQIFVECMSNPWYFLREVLRIPVDGLPIEVGGGVGYQMDRNNLACWYCFLNGIDHYQSKPRQRGKTQDAVAKINYAYHFGNLSSVFLFFNKDQKQANSNLYRLKAQRDMMPSYLQMRFTIDENGKADKGIDNTTTIKNPVTNNRITTMGKATSVESAKKLGRGDTASIQYLDEFDFIPYQIEILRSSSFAYSRAAENAKKFGSLYGRILTSTPGDLDTKSGADATDMVNRMLTWEERFYDEDIEKFRKNVNEYHNRFVFIEHTWQRLKLTNEWYRVQCGLVDNHMETIYREVDLKRIRGSNNSPFSREALMYIINNEKQAIQSIDLSSNLFPIQVYQKIKRSKPYVLVVDPAEGLAQDNTAMVLIDPQTDEIVAEFECPYITQRSMWTMMERFMDDYASSCMIVVESNKGRELINYALASKYRPQVYYDAEKLNDKVIEKTDPYGRLKQESMQTRAFGVWTGRNRSMFYAILENIMEERKEIVKTKNLIADICNLIRYPTGKVAADTGKHDDTVMAYLIGLYVLYHSSYEALARYGIRRGSSEEFNDHDDEGNLTENGILRKLGNMAHSLPENLREFIRSTMTENNTATTERDEMQKLIAMNRGIPQTSMDQSQQPFQSQAPENQDYWAEYDRGVMGNNQQNIQSTTFNMDDYI